MALKSLQHSIAKAKREGYASWVVEKWISYFGRKGKGPPGNRVDMFNLIDLVCIRADVRGVLGVQSCMAGDLAAHREKALANEFLAIWKAGGNRFVIQAWDVRVLRLPDGSRLRTKDGSVSKKKQWACQEIEL